MTRRAEIDDHVPPYLHRHGYCGCFGVGGWVGLINWREAMGIQDKAKEIAARSSDAYSAGRYVSWFGCALALLKRGYTDKEVEAILRSKWMRWAGDSSDKPFGRYTSGDILRFIDDPINKIDKEEVRKLAVETFG